MERGDGGEAYRHRCSAHPIDCADTRWLEPCVSRGIFLDLGCGPGMLLAAAAEEGYQGIGVDVSLVWLVVAHRLIEARGGRPVLAAALAEALPAGRRYGDRRRLPGCHRARLRPLAISPRDWTGHSSRWRDRAIDPEPLQPGSGASRFHLGRRWLPGASEAIREMADPRPV